MFPCTLQESYIEVSRKHTLLLYQQVHTWLNKALSSNDSLKRHSENLIYMYYKLGPFNKSDWYFSIPWEMTNWSYMYVLIISQTPSLQEQVYNHTVLYSCPISFLENVTEQNLLMTWIARGRISSRGIKKSRVLKFHRRSKSLPFTLLWWTIR